jgi:hypothetical protein
MLYPFVFDNVKKHPAIFEGFFVKEGIESSEFKIFIQNNVLNNRDFVRNLRLGFGSGRQS